MSEYQKINVAVLGASGYTGADFIRLGACHPHIQFIALTANSRAGQNIGKVFPHLRSLDLPILNTVEELQQDHWAGIDAIICALPHGTTQEITKSVRDLAPHIRIIDMSADFRLRDGETYAQWYGHAHLAPQYQKDAVYGLSEFYREDIKQASIIACPGCYPTATLLALIPGLKAGLLSPEDVIIDAKSGVSGAGRGLKEAMLFCETGEGTMPYSVGSHRHAPEIEQELSLAANSDLTVNFTPHLIPMSRGELVTCHVKLKENVSFDMLYENYVKRYEKEDFVHILDKGVIPKTQDVRGSNHCIISLFEDRIKGRVIIIAALDNLVKGSAGQAMQNFNLAFGFQEKLRLEQLPLFT